MTIVMMEQERKEGYLGVKQVFKLWKQYKMIVLYLFFGVCSTLINIAVYYICARQFKLSTVVSTSMAWTWAVVFAYITNKVWVFESKALVFKVVVKEVGSFMVCRLLTGVLDLIIMLVCVDILKMNDLVIKVASNVIVVILNYIGSKWLVFK